MKTLLITAIITGAICGGCANADPETRYRIGRAIQESSANMGDAIAGRGRYYRETPNFQPYYVPNYYSGPATRYRDSGGSYQPYDYGRDPMAPYRATIDITP